MYRTTRFVVLIGALLLMLAACALPEQPAPVGQAETPEASAGAETEPAHSALIDALVLGQDPSGAYTLEIQGHLPDGCTAVETVAQAMQGDRIVVSLFTRRDAEALCTEALVPFSHTLTLETRSLAPGDYVVDVQGVTATLTLAGAPVQAEETVIAQDALIDAVRLLPEGLPDGPYTLEIQGHLRDGCTTVDSVAQTVEPGRILVTVSTARPQGALCTEALVPFTHTLPLDVAGLQPGESVIDVQGVTTTLTLSAMGSAPAEPGRVAVRQAAGAARRGAVDQFDILFLESFPVQIDVVIQGNLADGCTSLSGVQQWVQGDMIHLEVYTQRRRDAVCTMALVPYSETVRLDTRGLAPGAYTVEVHGLTQELLLDESMLGSGEGSSPCPAPQEGQRQLVNASEGYCLAHPEVYTARSLAPGAILISAMERSDLPEARIVSLIIEEMGPTEGRDLETLAEELWGAMASRGVRLTRSETRFGDTPVLLADGIPGRMGQRQALISDGEVYYLLSLSPIDQGYAQQTAYAEELWEQVAASWRFYR